MKISNIFNNEKVSFVIRIISILAAVGSAFYLVLYFLGEYNAKKLSEEMASMHLSGLQLEENKDINISASMGLSQKDDEKEVIEIVSPSGQLVNLSEIEDLIAKDESSGNESNEVTREPLEIRDSMQQFYQENPDTIGWIKVDGTKIDNVVVQSTDNDKYLHTNFKQKESQPGTIFADYRCDISTYPDLRSDNIILYGHKQRSGTMFGTLDRYKNNLEFYKQHPTFTFSTLYDESTYKIVAVFVAAVDEKDTQTGTVFDYQNYIDFNDTRSFVDFVVNIKMRSQYATPVSIQKGDKFITLSTCSYEFNNARFVVVGRKVRENEPVEVDTKNAIYVEQKFY